MILARNGKSDAQRGGIVIESEFVFGTKAETLRTLAARSDDFVVPELEFFAYEDWCEDANAILGRLAQKFRETSVAVRSSSQQEDTDNASMAGAYLSVLHVPSSNSVELKTAIDAVFLSYGANVSSFDQVLVQAMVNAPTVSGVIMTKSIDDGAPYYVLNYNKSGETDAITGGREVQKSVLVHRDTPESYCRSPRLRKMLSLAKTLEKLCCDDALDIEFAIDQADRINLLQVRRITSRDSWHLDKCETVDAQLPRLEERVTALSAAREGLYGNCSILGNMPDWNPAEILGVHPSPMAISLYRRLITQGVWHKARATMGYRTIPDTDLLVTLAGRPYVDVRSSFNSFVPDGIPPSIAEKLVSEWLFYLKQRPELHDKIEFGVVPTIYDFQFDHEHNERLSRLLNKSELAAYKESLITLTKRNLSLSANSSVMTALQEITQLEERQRAREPFSNHQQDAKSLKTWMKAVLDECREYGTGPFAVLARHGFIAEALLRSMVRAGAISEQRVFSFKNSFSTVAGDMSADLIAVAQDKLHRDEFLRRYGHLRPGTYEVSSRSYKERDSLFDFNTVAQATRKEPFSLADAEREKIDRLFQEAAFTGVNADRFFAYAEQAIVGREYAKFVFTRSLSAALDALVAWGKHYGIDREDLSYLTIDDVFESHDAEGPSGAGIALLNKISKARRKKEDERLIKVGYIIRDVWDLYVVPMHRSKPHFITSQRVEAEAVFLDTILMSDADLGGKIVCIENADPGFDWIFSKNIVGLITKYGGSNSHMAVRCAELNLPGAIGCGELIFASISDRQQVVLACDDQQVLASV